MYFAARMNTVDIILPVYNPLTGWEDTVIHRFQSIEKRFPDLRFHLHIINDGSSKLDELRSVEQLKSNLPNFNWISYSVNQGKGYALRQGVASSTADAIVYTDIDWPYTESSMVEMIHLLEQGAMVVIGVRDKGYYAHLPTMRKVISRWLRMFNGYLLRLKVDDTQAGLKAFRSEIKPVFMTTTINRYLFDLEFIYLLAKRKIKVESLPITLREGITFSKMNRKILLQEAFNFLHIWVR